MADHKIKDAWTLLQKPYDKAIFIIFMNFHLASKIIRIRVLRKSQADDSR